MCVCLATFKESMMTHGGFHQQKWESLTMIRPDGYPETQSSVWGGPIFTSFQTGSSAEQTTDSAVEVVQDPPFRARSRLSC